MSYTNTQAGVIIGRLGFAGSTRQRITAFQYGYNLGAWLSIDGQCGQATSAAIARSVAAGGKASAHFAWTEMRCKCGGRYSNCRRILVDRELLRGLERYRNMPGVDSVSIVSGYRCPSHNRAVGGASSSQHVRGKAADVRPELSLAAVEGMHFFNGKGFQLSNKCVVHMDVRETWVRPWPYAS